MKKIEEVENEYQVLDNYISILLSDTVKVKKNDVIFLSASIDDSIFVNRLVDAIHNRRANVYVNYYEKNASKDIYSSFMNKKTKFLFVMNEHIEKTIAEFLCECNLNNEGNINSYITAPMELLDNQDSINYLENKSYNNAHHKFLTEQRNITDRIKNLELTKLYIKTLNDIDLSCKFINSTENNFNSRIYPNYVVELIPRLNSMNGFVNASGNVYYKGLKIEDLQLELRDSMVHDFDCKDKETSELFKSEGFTFDRIGLVKEDNPYIKFNTDRINIPNTPYLMFKSSDDCNLYVPINSSSLEIYGDNGKNTDTIYECDNYSPKILRR